MVLTVVMMAMVVVMAMVVMVAAVTVMVVVTVVVMLTVVMLRVGTCGPGALVQPLSRLLTLITWLFPFTNQQSLELLIILLF